MFSQMERARERSESQYSTLRPARRTPLDWYRTAPAIFRCLSWLTIDVAETHSYTQPGTHFAVVRVTARRDGDAHSPFRRIQNVARARIVVS